MSNFNTETYCKIHTQDSKCIKTVRNLTKEQLSRIFNFLNLKSSKNVLKYLLLKK